MAALVQATDGNFYGTTSAGGANGGGTVFKITPSGTLTTLHSFDCTDGAYPSAGWSRPPMGTSTGQRSEGGANGYGTVFKITPSGTLTTLHSFDAHGRRPTPQRGWSRPPTGTSTGQHRAAGPTAMARSSKSPRAAR